MPGSWEHMAGASFCLPPWKNAISKVLGKVLLLDAKPWCSTVLHPLSQQRVERNKEVWDSWKVKEGEEVCLQEQFNSHFFFFFASSLFSVPLHTCSPLELPYSSCWLIAALSYCVLSAKALNKVFWRNIALILPCLFYFAFPRYTYRQSKLSIRIHTTVGLFTIRRVLCSQCSPLCKFFTILFI